MLSSVTRRLRFLVVPEGVLLAVLAVLARGEALPDALAEVSPHYAYAVFGVAALLAVRFRRGRTVFALLALAAAGLGLPALHGDERALSVGAAAVAVLLPLNLAAFALLPERGIRSRAGMLRLTVLGVQAAAVFIVARTGWPRAAELLDAGILPGELAADTPLPQPALLAFAVAILVLAVRSLVRQDVLDRSVFWAVVAALPAVGAGAAGDVQLLWFSAAALVLAMGVVEASYAMAYRDGLTGLPTRRALNEALQRLDGHYTIAMVDVDHFKKVNDRHGHDVGDQVLRMVASELARTPGGGKAYRYGGEEFAILFAGKGVKEARPHLEQVRKAIKARGFTLRSPDRPRRKPKKQTQKQKGKGRVRRKTLTVTVSVGAAERDGRSDEPEEVIKAADRALYRAKDGGRNRVVA